MTPPADAPTVRALIVDDEELARRGIRSRLRNVEGVEIVGECASGRSAVHHIRADAPDLVFLDVQMPGLSGFDVVEAVGPAAMPVTIFVTAYDQYALRAFEAQALDYLLKPIDDERFQQAVARAVERVQSRHERALAQRLRALVSALDRGEHPDPPTEPSSPRFTVRTGGRIAFVDADEIDYVEAAGDYVTLHTARGAHLLRSTMADMEDALGPAAFVRIHRSTIVRAAHVRELRPHGRSGYLAVLDDGTELKVSRGYREAALRRLSAA